MTGGTNPELQSNAQRRAAGPDVWPRILSGLFLAFLAVAICLAGLWPFATLVAVAAGVVAWEWGRVVRGGGWSATTSAHTLAVTAAICLTGLDRLDLALAALLIAVPLIAALDRSAETRNWSVAGMAICGIVAMALTWLRIDGEWGALSILYLFLIVWMTDSAAFATGRLLGGPKLMPRVSPKKRWSGFIGGLLFPMLAGLAFAAAFGLGDRLPSLAAQSVLLAFSTQAGDLAESAMKRKFGVKDASSLIPGHGGLLDRVDGLMLAAVVATLLAALRDPAHPGRGLLLWS